LPGYVSGKGFEGLTVNWFVWQAVTLAAVTSFEALGGVLLQ